MILKLRQTPGLYLIGMPFLRRRKSSFIDGACSDAQDLVIELSSFLDRHRNKALTCPFRSGGDRT